MIEAPASTSESARPASKPAGARRIRTGPLVVGGLSVAWLTLIVLIPLAAVVVRSFEGGVDEFGGWDQVNAEFFDPEKGSVAEIERDLGVSTAG